MTPLHETQLQLPSAWQRLRQVLSVSLVGLIPIVWLLPNHYLPWQSAWQDAAALALVLAAGLLTVGAPGTFATTVPRWQLYALLALSTALLFQATLERQRFVGDIVVGLLYLGPATAAVAIGSLSAQPDTQGRTPGLIALSVTVVAAAVLSVGIGLSQWTQTYSITLGLVSVDLPLGARPFANLGQANHFNSVCFLGLCSLWLLYEGRLIGRVGMWIGGTWLLLGMVTSGSRTAWLQLAVFLLVVGWIVGRTRTQLRFREAVFGVSLFVLMTLVWPHVNGALGLTGGRSVSESLSSGGTRFTLWWSLLDAISQEPWLGYGWMQTALAQQSTALSHPPVGYLFEQAHNLILDLWIWCGIPLGSAVLVFLVIGLLFQMKALRDARAAGLMAMVLGLLAHAMVEQPLHYAYFLIPFCLALGALHALCPTGQSLQVSSRSLAALSGAMLALLALVSMDYLKAEESFRQLRMESARIGLSHTPSPPPQLRVLDQLEAFQWFVRTEARPQMTAAELERMRTVSARYPQPPVLLRHALAEGLNGNPAAALRVLALICKMHNTQRCEEARESWKALQSRYPVLQTIEPAV